MVTYPLVSVIMPVYNAARFLRDALESIRRQNYDPLEIIVVDDGSTDESPQILAGYGQWIRYLRQENRGPAAARNEGLKLAKGQFITFLDADDIWPEGKLALQVERLITNPDLDIVLGRIQYVTLPGAKDLNVPFEGPEKTLTGIHLGCGVYRKNVFDKVGLLDEELWVSHDQDWFLRVREANIPMIILKETTLIYRVHNDNLTHNLTYQKSELGIVIQKSLKRRRKLGLGDIGKWADYDERKKNSPPESNPDASKGQKP